MQDGSHREWGARPIRRIIQNEIENVVSLKYLHGDLKENSKISINGKNGELIFTITSKNLTKTKSKTI